MIQDEFHDRNEPLFDYTMRPYSTGTSTEGRPRSVNVLYRAIAGSSQEDRWMQLIGGLRAALGVDRTVWGIKFADGRLYFELYFYFRSLTSSSAAPELRSAIPAAITYPQVFAALDPTHTVRVAYPVHAPVLMMSIDVDDVSLDRGWTDVAHLYFMSGMAYDLGAGGMRHTNHYEFFETNEPLRIQAMVGHLINGLAHGSACGPNLQKVLIPELYSCRTVCLAAKQQADAAYFSGVQTQQLLWLIEKQGWPAPIVDYVKANEEAYSHVRWDVGIDFRSENGVLHSTKSGIYGTF